MFLDIIKSIIYGIVEGITEWLPISSTGHLILLEDLIPFKNVSAGFFEMYEVVIQLGAIIAVILLFFKKLWPFQNKPSLEGAERYINLKSINLWLKVLVASLPSAIIGLPLDDILDTHLYNKTTVSITLILYGILFILVERFNKSRTPKINKTSGITFKTAALIGCFQMLALIPGTSRSGATILGAILIGLSRPAAAEFSFFLAIPTMVGASLLKIVKFLSEASFTGEEIFILLVGMIVSFVVSVLAIRALMAYVKKKDFSFFGYYRIVLGLIVMAFVIL
ncbi:MAG: undecaprenyl-diphosphate phosphatase [Clostridia bacterium]|nr:undecaprenyl-diphosphate phosphatase [Clostridia bacterium]